MNAGGDVTRKADGGVVAGVYGVGVGPGDPGLLTLRAAEVLRAATLLIAPRASAERSSVALWIVAEFVSPDCEVTEAVFPMSDDHGERSRAAGETAEVLMRCAARGGVAVMVTLGDAMTYSTWGYVLRAAQAACTGSQVIIETVPGVTSFAAAAARLGEPLAEGADALLVWPAVVPADVGALLDVAPNVVALKAGRRLASVVDAAGKEGARVSAVQRLGMDGERLAAEASELLGGPEEYFTTAIMHRERP